jgi:hypothetical protein
MAAAVQRTASKPTLVKPVFDPITVSASKPLVMLEDVMVMMFGGGECSKAMNGRENEFCFVMRRAADFCLDKGLRDF